MNVLGHCGLAHFDIMTKAAAAAYCFDVDLPRDAARDSQAPETCCSECCKILANSKIFESVIRKQHG
jgi:hypothetical protein